jgi:tripartite-type tricarboxylate transporter receptor subunit TctC
MIRLWTIKLSTALVFAACSTFSMAQNYPTKPVRMILPFPPGGPTNLIGRMLAQKLGEHLGQAVPTDNRPGASGNIGLELAAKAPQDGYTVVLSSPVILVWYGMLAPTGTRPH